MTLNFVARGEDVQLNVGNGVAGGSPVVFGQMPGVALTSTPATGSQTAVVATCGIFNLSVKGYNGSSNTAITAGAIVYYDSGNTPHINVNNSGVRYGFALAAVGSGSTATIPVKIGYGG